VRHYHFARRRPCRAPGGELLKEMAERRERRDSGGTNQHSDSSNEELSKPSLQDLGVTKKQSHIWQKLAGLGSAARIVFCCPNCCPTRVLRCKLLLLLAFRLSV
jgi:hypothetical protein